MSKMWRRIYSSPSARFSYEKVSIGTWYPFPVCVELPVLIFLVKTHEENNNKCHSPKKPVIGFTAHHQLDENVSISAWNPFPVCLCPTSGSDFSRQRARRKTNKLQIATPLRNLSSNPPQEVCALKQKNWRDHFKSFFGEATKLQEILCHQENAKQRKKNITIIISIIHYYQYVHQWCGNLSFVFHTDCDAKHDKKK